MGFTAWKGIGQRAMGYEGFTAWIVLPRRHRVFYFY